MTQSNSAINVHIYPSPFEHESRMLKITKSLGDMRLFDKIYVLATWEPGLKQREALDENREVVRIERKNKTGLIWKAIATIEWSLKVSRFLKDKKVVCVNCHSLPVLPLCVLLKLKHRAKLVYDTHELETETVGSVGIRRHVSKIIERLLIRFVDETIVVNDSIAEWYKKAYGLDNVWVVKNVPCTRSVGVTKTTTLREKFRIRDDQILFLYQGMIAKGRGIDLLLRIFAKAGKDKHVVFMGDGGLVENVMKYSERFGNIHYQPAVPPDVVSTYTGSADIGLSIIENACLSYYLCLPNKVFEYVCCGLPVIVSDFPNMAGFVDEYSCGWKVPVEEVAIGSVINSITREHCEDKKIRALKARSDFGWHMEEPVLLDVYRGLGLESRTSSASH